MIEYIFNLNQARCHINDKNTYIIAGWFKFDNPEENTVKIFLDKKEIPCKIDVYDSPDIRVKYMGYNAGVTKEYFISFELPEDYKQYKKLKVYTVSPEKERKFSAEIPVSKIEFDKNNLDHCIDSCQFPGEEIIITGWCASVEPIEVRAYHTDSTRIDCEVIWQPRADVKFLYREHSFLQHSGFTVKIKDTDTDLKNMVLVFKAGNIKTRETINIEAKRKEWKDAQVKSKNPVNRLRTLTRHHYVSRTFKYIQVNGLKRFLERVYEKTLQKNSDEVIYGDWLRKHTPSEEELQAQSRKRFEYRPRFSIVVPLYKTPEIYLKALVESVKKQSYENWKLYLSDGSGENSPMERILSELEKSDPRIKVLRNNRQLKISENTNAAMKAADGDYIVFADHDDLLTRDALYECVVALNNDPEIDFIYSDEDKVSSNGRKFFTPHFKPDFNIDLLRSMNYFCHLCVVKKSLIDKVGMLNPEFDGAQDYDFVLRCVEQTEHIYHIPKILYHWRADDNSTSGNPESKRYAFEAGKRAIEEHCARLGYNVEVSHGRYLGLYRVKYLWKEQPLISIIIPNKDHIDDLDKCIQSIEKKSSYKNYEYIIIENNSTEEETFQYYKDLEKKVPKAKVVYYKGDFNYSKINNFGVQYARGDYYLLLNNDTEIINPDCLYEMLSYCMRDDVGIVGARLYYPDNTIQHAGVVVGFGGVAGHAFVGFPKDHNGYCNRIICAQDYSAVTAACMMVKKSVYEAVNGLTPEFKVAFNDIDFCLKVRSLGYLVVYNPNAELYHYESKSRGYEDTPEKVARFQQEISTFIERWPDILQKGDPYYNVNLTLDRQDFSLR